MTKCREWPNQAAEARDRSAEEAIRGIKLLQPLVDGTRFDGTETLRRQAQALNCFQMIVRFLESAGARTRPD